jgi:PAS domain S-box-containing protein
VSRPGIASLIRRSLRAWFFLPSCAAILVLGVLAGAWMLREEFRNSRLAVNTLAKYVDHHAMEAISQLSRLARRVQRADADGREAALRDFLALSTRFERVLLLDAENRIVHALPDGNRGGEFSLDMQPVGQEGLILSRPFPSASAGHPVISVGCRVDQNLTLVGELDLKGLQGDIQSVFPRDEAVFLLMDAHGNLISHPDLGRVARQENLGALALVRRVGTQPVAGFMELDDDWVLAACARIPGTGWLLVAGKPALGVLAPLLGPVVFLLSGAALMLMLLSLRLSQVLARQVAEPLARFARDIQSFAVGGAREGAVLPEAFRELNEVQGEFSRMSAVLLDRENALRHSEERHRRIVETANEGILIIDRQGRIEHANSQLSGMLGITPEDMEGRRAEEFLFPEDISDHARQVEARGRGEASRYDRRLRHRDGSEVWASVSAAPLRDRDGTIIATLGMVTDISERKRDEARLVHEATVNLAQAKLAKTLTANISSLDDIARAVHGWALRLTGSRYGFTASIDPETGASRGHTLSDMMGEGACQVREGSLSFARGPDGYPGLWGHALNTGVSFYTNEAPNHPTARGVPEGHVPVSRFLAVPAIFENRIKGLIALANPERDYTDQDLAAVEGLADLFALAVRRFREREDLLRETDKAQAASRAKSEFLANMSHEIRTPLNGIMGMLQLLALSPLIPEQREHVDHALSASRRLTRLLSDILDLSRIEAELLSLRCSDFQVQDLLSSVRDLFRLEAGRKGLVLVLEKDPEVPDWLNGDEDRLRQILFNLVGNAVKFTDQGRVEARISLGAVGEGPDLPVRFEVRDTGPGIPPDRIKDLFNPFTQGETTLARKHQGAGLGLSIVRRLAELMGGSVNMESGLGQGTTVHVALRLALGKAGERRARPQEGWDVRGGRVLLVEDDRMNRTAMRRILEKAGVQVSVATRGQEAVDSWRAGAFDLVLMDIQMPDMDGVQATRIIRREEAERGRKRTPIVALTAYAMEQDREAFLAAGMDDYLAKPVEIAEVLQTMGRLLNPDDIPRSGVPG